MYVLIMPSHLIRAHPYIPASLLQVGREDEMAEFEDGMGSGDETDEGEEHGGVIRPVVNDYYCAFLIPDGGRRDRLSFPLFGPTLLPHCVHCTRLQSVCQEVKCFSLHAILP